MGQRIYFTDLELERLQMALSMDDSDDQEAVAAMDSADYKIGLALNQPWAIEKRDKDAAHDNG